MAKKILMISPLPSHPPNAGSNVRILHVASALRDMGHEVHLLFAQCSDDCDLPNMQAFWGHLLYHVPARYPRRNLSRSLVQAAKQFLNLRLHSLDNWYYAIDDWYDPSLDPHIARLSKKIKPDVVWIEYVFLSRALVHFDHSVLKVIDTHDAFANRHRAFERIWKNDTYRWWTATPAGEALGLGRADVVVAIQGREAKYFKRLNLSRVVTVGHLARPDPLNDPIPDGHEVLFVGTDTPDNRLAIEFFVEDVLPNIRNEYPDAKLLLVGKICDVIDDHPACVRLGVLDDLAMAYRRTAIVINPAYTGTGMAIKSIEALSYGKPLVSTPRGIRGLEDGADDAFCVAASAADFSEKIVQLFENSERRRTMAKKAYEFARHYHQVNLERLVMILQNEDPRQMPRERHGTIAK